MDVLEEVDVRVDVEVAVEDDVLYYRTGAAGSGVVEGLVAGPGCGI